MLNLAVAWTLTLLAGGGASPARVSFPTADGGVVSADLYGKGERSVVLAHGGRFTKESWRPQAQVLVEAGFQALAIDFRGHGESHGPPTPTGDEEFLFETDQEERLMREILRFLAEP